MATRPILAWEIPQTEEPGSSPWGQQKSWTTLATKQQFEIFSCGMQTISCGTWDLVP